MTDLHPSGFMTSMAVGVGGSGIVGYGMSGNAGHALLWKRDFSGVTDLTPAGFTNAGAYGASAKYQVGDGFDVAAKQFHALLWLGSAQSCIDLHPAAARDSHAYGSRDRIQVGEADGHAYLWFASAESAKDIHPAGFAGSRASAISKYGIVGYATIPRTTNRHATFWKSDGTGSVDLHKRLQIDGIEFVSSEAVGINDEGYIVGNAKDRAGRSHPVLWKP